TSNNLDNSDSHDIMNKLEEDIKNEIIEIQDGGKKKSNKKSREMARESSVMSDMSTEHYEDIIHRILKGIEVKPEELINIEPLFKGTIYKKLKTEDREKVFNTIQDLRPLEEKKLYQEKEEDDERNLAYFICNNCNFTQKIQPKTLIFSRTSD